MWNRNRCPGWFDPGMVRRAHSRDLFCTAAQSPATESSAPFNTEGESGSSKQPEALIATGCASIEWLSGYSTPMCRTSSTRWTSKELSVAVGSPRSTPARASPKARYPPTSSVTSLYHAGRSRRLRNRSMRRLGTHGDAGAECWDLRVAREGRAGPPIYTGAPRSVTVSMPSGSPTLCASTNSLVRSTARPAAAPARAR